MKKRRTLIIAILLVAALALGIGYAALSTELTVTGSVTNQPHPINVVYTGNAQVVRVTGDLEEAATASNVICTANAKSATFNVSKLAHNGDFVVASFEVINYNEYKVQMENPTVSYTGDEFYEVETYWVNAQGARQDAAPELSKDQTATFYVKVMMNKTTAESLSGDFTVSIKAASSQ